MRGLLRDFADRGGTVLLSSHLLHEIEVIADDLVVIGNGRIVAAGAKTDLLASAGAIVRTPDPATLADVLTARGITASSVGTDGLLVQADAEQVGRAAFAAGVPVLELRAADGTGLEEMFLQLTADTQRDQQPDRQPEPEGALA
jgi:ABC-2 type transport system ATP-binding protein